MRLFKPTYRDKKTGKTRTVGKWWVELKDHLQIVRRFPAFKDKAQSAALGRRIERLAVCRGSGEQPDRELSQWLERIPAKMLGRFAEIGLLDSTRAAAGKPLSAHVEDFQNSLLAKGDTKKQAKQVVTRTRKIMEGCGFKTWTDIRADRVEQYLADRRAGGLSAQTSNFYLQAIQQFSRWMVQNRRAGESPVAHLGRLNVRTDRRHDRTTLTVDQVRRLLVATTNGPVRYGMEGRERVLLYRMAVETGLRANELLRSLKVGSCNLSNHTVTVVASYSKRRREDTLPLRPETAAELQPFFADKLPTAKAFGGTYRRLTDKTALMIQADLEAAGIDYVDDAGRSGFSRLTAHNGLLAGG